MKSEGLINDGWRIGTLDIVSIHKLSMPLKPLAIVSFIGGKLEGPAFGNKVIEA